MNRFFRLEFLPLNADLALLVLRVWTGLAMLGLHGWGKVTRLLGENPTFGDPLGIGPIPSLILAATAESLFALFLALGFLTRLSALMLAGTMGVAFFLSHGAKLSGQGNGELAFIFLGAFIAILIAGPGRYSLDHRGSSSATGKLKAVKK